MSLFEVCKNFIAKMERRKKRETCIAEFKVNDVRCFIIKYNTKAGPYLAAYLDGNWNCCASYDKDLSDNLSFCIESLVNDALKLK